MEENKLAVKPLGLLMLELSIPAIIAQLVSIIYNMVDRIFIGRIENGTSAMAALSVSLPVITLITAVTRLLGIGGSAAVRHQNGTEKPERGGGDPGHQLLGPDRGGGYDDRRDSFVPRAASGDVRRG